MDDLEEWDSLSHLQILTALDEATNAIVPKLVTCRLRVGRKYEPTIDNSWPH